ncbi:hypothetical protein ACFQZS_09695 [Mucilaginibacter calamicampi]|uniref:Lipoprotein n=1 Tax=Mucilaginibacter calamicampi TaxID=1302352 RepID=A0ABW2YXW6_9SPHI
MKVSNVIIPAIVALALAACTSTGNENGNADTMANSDTVSKPTEVEAASMCFLRTEGKDNKDTTSTELVIKDNKVTGQMYWHPFEKDSRKGALNGTLKGDTVNAVWSFMQEGMQDTLALQFLIAGDNLMQKPLKLNTQTGRQQTDNAAGFTLLHHPSVSLKK